MTKLLKKAFDEAARLDGVEQDALARWLLDELTSQRKWDEVSADSQAALATLADEALAEHRQNRTQALDPEKL